MMSFYVGFGEGRYVERNKYEAPSHVSGSILGAGWQHLGSKTDLEIKGTLCWCSELKTFTSSMLGR